MKYLQFVMLGGQDYVDRSMSDKFIRDNILRNVRGAAEIGGKVRITVLDEASKVKLFEHFDKSGISEEERQTVEFVNAKDLMNAYKKIDPERHDVLKGVSNPTNPRFVLYADMIKLLSIYNAPKDQLVEFADLDQHIDIKKNPDFSVDGKVGIYTSMHLGMHSNDAKYRRHDLSKKELLKYYKANIGNPSDHPYSNERSYLVGVGGDSRVMNVAYFYARNKPNFLINDHITTLPYEQRFDPMPDADMPQKLKETLIKKYHLDFNQTSLLPRERAQGKMVGFARLAPERDVVIEETKAKERHSVVQEAEESFAKLGVDSGEIDLSFNPDPDLNRMIERHQSQFSPEAIRQEEGRHAIAGNGGNNSFTGSSYGDIALAGAAVAGVAYLLGRGGTKKPSATQLTQTVQGKKGGKKR